MAVERVLAGLGLVQALVSDVEDLVEKEVDVGVARSLILHILPVSIGRRLGNLVLSWGRLEREGLLAALHAVHRRGGNRKCLSGATSHLSCITETMRTKLYLTQEGENGQNNTSLYLEKLEKSYFSLFIFCLWLPLYLDAAEYALRSVTEDDRLPRVSNLLCFAASTQSPERGQNTNKF